MERQLRCGAYHARKGHLRRGYAFLTVMVYISFLSVMGTSLLAMASTGQKVSNRRLAEKQALNLAQGAADFTVARVL
ncbi:MAG: hypothetical protein FJ315_06650, partial [SAR202 cluster bacterium]|nr:hypothetical protein [SAR202 cluster bacterium]